ncbi:hypothetical protein [Escherichia coli]|nr:hypothetical protein [Escherichia coli]
MSKKLLKKFYKRELVMAQKKKRLSTKRSNDCFDAELYLIVEEEESKRG